MEWPAGTIIGKKSRFYRGVRFIRELAGSQFCRKKGGNLKCEKANRLKWIK
jgi:hypothetical protein